MSIRQRTWMNKDGSTGKGWALRYTDAQGTPRQKTFERKKDAEVYELTVKTELRDGVHVADSASETVKAAGDKWLTSVEGSCLERSTVDQYTQHVRLHVEPFIGATKLSALTVPAVRVFEDQLRAEGRSTAMVRKVLVTLGTLIADAQDRGVAARNPVRDRKRGAKKRRAEDRQRGKLKVGVDIPLPSEIKALLPNVGAGGTRWRALLLVAIFCGLRASEIRGLPWRNVDLKRGELKVTQRADRYNKIGPPKSESSIRTVPIPPEVVVALKEWKLACPKGALDLVFPNGAGNIEGLANIRRRGLIPAMIAAGLSIDTGKLDEEGNPILDGKYTGMHALRHFFASWCINRVANGGLGLPLKEVSELMGHNDIGITADTYGHLFPRADDGKALAAASKALFS